jgi:pyruvate kinase
MKKKHKILCTLGPSSLHLSLIRKMDRLGVDIFRINLSHTSLDSIESVISTIQKATQKPICIDTEGAQVRNRYVEEGGIEFKENSTLTLTADDVLGNSETLSINIPCIDQIRTGSLISVDFDTVLLQVIGKDEDQNILKTKVLVGGKVGNNKAITLDQALTLPTLSSKDREAIRLALKRGVSHFALSFASGKEAVQEVRDLVGEEATIISKVESRDGVHHLQDILEASDAILIDRGDLSREVAIEKIPFLQKGIIRSANQAGKPVYVATNLLESMVKDKKPTRAEVNDVANTLLDGADGLVLAAETAIGKHPTECVAMVSSMIENFSKLASDAELDHLLSGSSSYLIEPHGGKLVDRFSDFRSEEELCHLPELQVSESTVMDAEQIALGAFSPLQGFMNEAELKSVLADYRLPNGSISPLPIVLQVHENEAKSIKEGELIRLTSNKITYALLHVDEIFSYPLEKLVKELYGTTDENHPGVRMTKERGNFFISGKIDGCRRLWHPYKEYELTPRQTRLIFENKGWRRVVGFHTRNALHRAHEFLQMDALEQASCDGLFIHPVIGQKKKNDYTMNAILKSYELMMEKHYPKDRVLLGAFSTYSRYAGPREAVFTALCRKNFGCSHFIIGRDHTGVGNFYPPKAAHQLFAELGDIGIEPLLYDSIFYCPHCKNHVHGCVHQGTDALQISGTQAREMLQKQQDLPEWFMRKEISGMILKELEEGNDVFVS